MWLLLGIFLWSRGPEPFTVNLPSLYDTEEDCRKALVKEVRAHEALAPHEGLHQAQFFCITVEGP
jgi:hypothetical protein